MVPARGVAAVQQQIHDEVMQSLATALNQVELIERLSAAGRFSELPVVARATRESVTAAVLELRGVMAALRSLEGS